jgi:hypothetical protein
MKTIRDNIACEVAAGKKTVDPRVGTEGNLVIYLRAHHLALLDNAGTAGNGLFSTGAYFNDDAPIVIATKEGEPKFRFTPKIRTLSGTIQPL